ncbi:MAG TPA: ATP synthase F1 subunit epsilon [Patescibacteria group bacterium]|nr:ATP synthase F1 subunit epsilon [Patescibacteria group bacterium]
MKSLKFRIATPARVVYENDNVEQVTIPTTTGQITVLPNHIPLVSIIQSGELVIKDPSGENIIAVASGFLEIRANNEVIVLADHAEKAEEIDLDRAEEARKKAEEQMKQIKSVQDVDFARLQSKIDREMNRLKIGKKYKNIKQKPQ